MKVLHVITTVNRGGAENHLVELVRGQAQQGVQVAVAYLKGDGYWTAKLRELDVRAETPELKRYGELVPLWRLRALIRDWAPEIVHAHLPPAELYARLALLFLQPAPALVISKHNDEPFFGGPGQRIVGAWVARRASRVIAISDAVSAYTCRQLAVPAAHIVTVHYGIDPGPYGLVTNERCMALRSEWNIPPEAWVIGTVARLVPQKALHVLLSGYARYRTQARRSSRLVIVGRGPQETELKSLADKLCLRSEVVWAGFREDIPVVMNTFDTFALTSAYEGFGLVLLEAMAASRPVVATDVSAIPEIVQNDITGLLCRPAHTDDVANAFMRLEDTQTRIRLGTAGRDRVVSLFNLANMVATTLAVYRKCRP